MTLTTVMEAEETYLDTEVNGAVITVTPPSVQDENVRLVGYGTQHVKPKGRGKELAGSIVPK